MFSFIDWRKYLKKFFNPSLYMGGLDYVLKIWQNAEGKDKGILLLVFAPMFLCLGGFIFSIIHFVLFILPSFLFSFMGWGILTMLFGSGGKYFYKHFTGHELNTQAKDGVIDADFTEDTQETETTPEAKSEAKSEEPEHMKRAGRKKTEE